MLLLCFLYKKSGSLNYVSAGNGAYHIATYQYSQILAWYAKKKDRMK